MKDSPASLSPRMTAHADTLFPVGSMDDRIARNHERLRELGDVSGTGCLFGAGFDEEMRQQSPNGSAQN